MKNLEDYLKIYETYNTEKKRYNIIQDSYGAYKPIRCEKLIVFTKLKLSENERIKDLKLYLIMYITFMIFYMLIFGVAAGFMVLIIALIVFGVFGLIIFGGILCVLMPKNFFIIGLDGLTYKRGLGGIKNYDLNNIVSVNIKHIPEHRGSVAGYKRSHRITIPAHDLLNLKLINKYGYNKEISVNLINYKCIKNTMFYKEKNKKRKEIIPRSRF